MSTAAHPAEQPAPAPENRPEPPESTASKGSGFSPRGLLDAAINAISQIFLPLLNALAAAGILKGLLAALTMTGRLPTESSAYAVLNAMADAFFAFLPVFLAFTTANLVKANRFTAVFIAVVLLYPKLTEALAGGQPVTFVGIPVGKVNYAASVIPIILAVVLLRYVEAACRRLLPEVVEGPFTPLISVFVVGGATLVALGPLGTTIGSALAAGYNWVYALSPVAAGTILGGLIQLMVLFGFHWALVPIAISNISEFGSDTILAFFAPAVFAQAGACLAVCIKTRSRPYRAICLSAALSACFGITEPAMFGVTLPLKKPLVAVCISGAVGGATVGASGASAMSFAFPGLATLPVFLGHGFALMAVGCLGAMVLAFALSLIMRFPGEPAALKDGEAIRT